MTPKNKYEQLRDAIGGFKKSNWLEMTRKTIKIKTNKPMPQAIRDVLNDKSDKSHQRILEYYTGKLSSLELTILADPEIREGLIWGKPRKGHPEGVVLYHVQDVLRNVETYSTPETREKLRLIALIHDTFKYKVDRSQPRTGENHHGRIARKFAEKYITDESILQVIETHDDAYNAFNVGVNGNWGKAKDRAIKLINALGDNIDLYMQFYKCDNATGSKTSECYTWFENEVRERCHN